MQGLNEQLQYLRKENVDLKLKIEYMNADLMNKNNLLKKGEMQ